MNKVLPAGATLQRDKESYALRVTPPSGKISAADLEQIAAVVKEFAIPEMKITSGQRIMLFGIKEEHLEEVANKLPFRCGGHYVQACPGTDWCKFGLRDTMGFAQRLEEAFGTLKVPAKIKFGVSGCSFSCAEPYIRDLGYIGSKKGWTMIVGGNSGTRTQLGEILAKNLSDDEAMELTEKFLALYCAEGKKRTSHFVKTTGIEVIKEKLDLL